MILGYHVDSNVSKRMLLHRGSIESLEDQLAGYHCNHNRTPTVYHGANTVTNDLERFFLAVDRPELPEQRRSWGLVDDELQEISVGDRSWDRFADAVVAAAPDSAAPRAPSDAARIPFELTYDTGHVLPFVADSLAVSPPDATIGYVGANAVLQDSLASLIAKLDGRRSLAVADLDDLNSVDELGRAADLFIVDLGVDAALLGASTSTAGDHQPAALPAELARVFVGLERVIERERERLARGEHPRRFVLIHSWTVFWDAYVLANMDCSHTTAHSRVRRATVRPVPIDDEVTRELVAQERRLIRWAARGELGRRRFHVQAREPVSLGDVADYGGFGDGWAFPEENGIWTQGSRSEIALALDGVEEADYVLALVLDSICVAPDAILEVEAFANGERLASRGFRYGDPDWHIELAAATVAGGVIDLRFEIEEPRSLLQLGLARDDDRPLGLLLQTIKLLPTDDDAARAGLARERRLAAWAARSDGGERRLRMRLGESVDLTTVTDYGGFRNGWAYQDEAGIWTQGPRSELALALHGIGDGYYVIGLSLGTIATEPGSTLKVDALVNGERVASRDFKFGDPEWQFELPASVPADGNVELTFELDRLRSPLKLGWSADDRPLGLLLRSLRLEEVDRTVRLDERIVFDETSGAERFLGEGWSIQEREGVWTEGDRANLVLMLADDIPDDAELVLNAAPFVAPDHPVIEVQASARGEQLARRVFRHGEPPRLLRIPLPPARGRTVVELTLHDPARPVDLGLGDDHRRLGIQLRWLVVRKSTRRATLADSLRRTAAKLRRPWTLAPPASRDDVVKTHAKLVVSSLSR